MFPGLFFNLLPRVSPSAGKEKKRHPWNKVEKTSMRYWGLGTYGKIWLENVVNIIGLPYSVVLSLSITSFSWKYLLWFKFILGLMFFELVSILLYLPLLQIMIMNTWLNLNHNISFLQFIVKLGLKSRNAFIKGMHVRFLYSSWIKVSHQVLMWITSL